MPALTVTLLALVAIVALLAVSAFFSSSEIAIFSLPADWAAERAASGDSRAQVLAELTDDPHRLLVTLLVGNNVVNIAISSITTVVVASYLQPGLAVLVTTVLTSLLILVFGEIVPKAYGLGNAGRWSLTVATPVRLVERLLSPLITVLDALTGWLTRYISGEPGIERPYVD